MRRKHRDRSDALELLNTLGEAEAWDRAVDFIAPRLANSPVRARIAGLIQTFEPRPRRFEGWGVFRAQEDNTARLVREAPREMVEAYLGLLPKARLILIGAMTRGTWLAWLADGLSASLSLRPVHLVCEGRRFETVVARFDGHHYWFDALDYGNDPRCVDGLRRAIVEMQRPEALAISGMTPEQRAAYGFVFERQREQDAAREAEERREREAEEARQKIFARQAAREAEERAQIMTLARQRRARDQRREMVLVERVQGRARREVQVQARQAQRAVYGWSPSVGKKKKRQQKQARRTGGDQQQLQSALKTAGGTLLDFERRRDFWLVYWQTSSGARHRSAISRQNLTVLSSGVCLSGRDADFDLESLVGVIERRGY